MIEPSVSKPSMSIVRTADENCEVASTFNREPKGSPSGTHRIDPFGRIHGLGAPSAELASEYANLLINHHLAIRPRCRA